MKLVRKFPMVESYYKVQEYHHVPGSYGIDIFLSNDQKDIVTKFNSITQLASHLSSAVDGVEDVTVEELDLSLDAGDVSESRAKEIAYQATLEVDKWITTLINKTKVKESYELQDYEDLKGQYGIIHITVEDHEFRTLMSSSDARYDLISYITSKVEGIESAEVDLLEKTVVVYTKDALSKDDASVLAEKTEDGIYDWWEQYEEPPVDKNFDPNRDYGVRPDYGV